jgi:oligopeptide transport system permease protein
LLAYLGRRLLWLLPTLLLVSLVTFWLMHLVPGGPWDGEKTLPPAVVDNLNRRYGLDRPLWEQYLGFLAGALRGDLGVSFIRQNEPVTDLIRTALGPSALLGALTLAVALAVGVTLGGLAAVYRGSPLDRASVVAATVGASTPNFVLGILLVVGFALGLRLLPTSGWGGPQHLVLPVITLAAFPTAHFARMTRTAMLDVLHQDYVRTARAKGLPAAAVNARHVLRNALLPLLTVAGPTAAHLVAGSFIVESLFAIPGLGRLFVQSVLARDYGLIMGLTLFFAVIITTTNLVVDLLYAAADPRVRGGDL